MIQINGKTYQGNTVSIHNGVVIVDGKRVDDHGADGGVLTIEVRGGSIGELSTDASVSCERVEGSINAGGSVNCDDVGGNVHAGGSVNCDNVGGDVNAGGSVVYG